MPQDHHENVVSNLRIGVRFWESTVETAGYVPFHWHSSIELVCVLAGQLVFQINGRAHVIRPGNFVVVPSGVIHDVTNTANHALVLQVPLTFMAAYFNHPETMNFSTTGLTDTEAYRQVVAKFRELNQVNREQGVSAQLDSGILVLTILKLLVENFVRLDQPLTENASNIKSLLIYVNEHYRDKLSVKLLAETFGYNASYLSRLFKRQTGVTLGQYVYMIRLNNFYQDLINTELPVNDLFARHGLTNRRTAREQFRRMFGRLPKQIRLAHKKR